MKTSHIQYLYFFILLGYITAKPLNFMYGIEAIKALPFLGCMLGIVLFMFHEKGRVFTGRVINKLDIFIYFLFVLLYFVSVVRNIQKGSSFIGVFNESSQVLGIAIGTYGFIIYYIRQSENLQGALSGIMITMLAAPSFFVILNIAGFFLGVQFPDMHGDKDPTPSVMAGILGLNFYRTALFFATHPNNCAVAVGAIMVCNLMVIFFTPTSLRTKAFFLFSLLCCLIFLLILDSRGSIASVILVTGTCLVLKNSRFLGGLTLVIWCSPFIPFFVLSALALVSQSSIGENISREENDNDLATGNGRSIIWEHCVDAVRSPELAHFFGYGQVGHIRSGVAQKWSWKFPDYVAHNFFFQCFFDLGYVGVLFLLWVLHNSFRSAQFLLKQGMNVAFVFIAFSLYFPLSGTFESTFGVYNHVYTTLYLCLCICPILFKNAVIQQPSSSPPPSPILQARELEKSTQST